MVRINSSICRWRLSRVVASFFNTLSVKLLGSLISIAALVFAKFWRASKNSRRVSLSVNFKTCHENIVKHACLDTIMHKIILRTYEVGFKLNFDLHVTSFFAFVEKWFDSCGSSRNEREVDVASHVSSDQNKTIDTSFSRMSINRIIHKREHNLLCGGKIKNTQRPWPPPFYCFCPVTSTRCGSRL